MLEVAELEANGMQVAVLRPELETASILHSCAVTLVYVGWGWGLSVPDSTCCHDARSPAGSHSSGLASASMLPGAWSAGFGMPSF